MVSPQLFLRKVKMVDNIEIGELKEHPIEASEYYKRSLFRDKLVHRLLSVAFSCGLRDLKEATGLSESIEDRNEDLISLIEEDQMTRLVKYLRNIEPNIGRKFLGESFGKRAGEKIEFAPNGNEISGLLSDILFNNWFKPETLLSKGELETRVEEMSRVFNFGQVSIKETPYFDEAINSRYGEDSTNPSYEPMTSIIFDDNWRIKEIVDKRSEESYRRLNPREKVQKSFIRKAERFLMDPLASLKKLSRPDTFSLWKTV